MRGGIQVWAALTFTFICVVNAAESNLQVLKGFRYPEYDGQGRLKMEVIGDEAHMQADGRIKIINLRMVFYEEGRMSAEVTAPECIYDRAGNAATSTSEVTIARAEAMLSGVGFDWSAADGRFKIHNNTKVTLKNPTR